MAQTNRKNYQRNNQDQQKRQPNTPSISAKIDRFVNSDGNTRAYASVNIGGAVAIHNLRVVNSRNGLFVSMPQQAYRDSNGNTKYSEIAHPVTKAARDAINEKVLEAYNQALQESESDGFTEMEDDEDLPFDEDEDEFESFSQSM